MPYVLDYPAQLIQKVPSVVELADRVAYLEPSPESQLGREKSALPEPAAAFLDDARSGAAARLVAIEDHLHAMAVLLREQTVVYAVYSLIRPIAEMTGITRWLTDPQVTARNRAERAYADRLRSLVKMKSLRDAAITRHADERLRHLNASAARAGLGAARFPRSEDLVSLGLDEPAQRDNFGPFLHSLLAAHSHGTQYALMRMLKENPEEPPVGRIVSARVTTDAVTEANIAAGAMLSYLGAGHIFLSLLGIDASAWRPAVLYAMPALNNASHDAQRIFGETSSAPAG